MKKINYPCPCGGKVEWKKDSIIVEGVECGVLDVEYCSKCGEEYFPEDSPLATFAANLRFVIDIFDAKPYFQK